MRYEWALLRGRWALKGRKTERLLKLEALLGAMSMEVGAIRGEEVQKFLQVLRGIAGAMNSDELIRALEVFKGAPELLSILGIIDLVRSYPCSEFFSSALNYTDVAEGLAQSRDLLDYQWMVETAYLQKELSPSELRGFFVLVEEMSARGAQWSPEVLKKAQKDVRHLIAAHDTGLGRVDRRPYAGLAFPLAQELENGIVELFRKEVQEVVADQGRHSVAYDLLAASRPTLRKRLADVLDEVDGEMGRKISTIKVSSLGIGERGCRNSIFLGDEVLGRIDWKPRQIWRADHLPQILWASRHAPGLAAKVIATWLSRDAVMGLDHSELFDLLKAFGVDFDLVLAPSRMARLLANGNARVRARLVGWMGARSKEKREETGVER